MLDEAKDIYNFLMSLSKQERQWLFKFVPLIEKGDDILYLSKSGKLLSLKNLVALNQDFSMCPLKETLEIVKEFLQEKDKWLTEEIEILEDLNKKVNKLSH